ncbi:hypothetical protein EVAR_40818_1 [Eumeta japonica]|uniref:Uncharacterized protein n=1 Tax=Eumeta variegata TaxID=151549 RepID=A0A4C1WFR2_EUMVA|nr:hypothetical protein EVAR_40818_1 [Eumeta japonica]
MDMHFRSSLVLSESEVLARNIGIRVPTKRAAHSSHPYCIESGIVSVSSRLDSYSGSVAVNYFADNNSDDGGAAVARNWERSVISCIERERPRPTYRWRDMKFRFCREPANFVPKATTAELSEPIKRLKPWNRADLTLTFCSYIIYCLFIVALGQN